MKSFLQDLTVVETLDYFKEIDATKDIEIISEFLEKNPALINDRIASLNEIYLPTAKWRGTEHTYGFVENKDNDYLDIKHASSINPDKSLRGNRINIKLGSLYTINYPGWGRHNILLHFKCKHAYDDIQKTIEIEFQQKFISKEGEAAGNIGDFIFLGLKVPNNGLQFSVQTINICNDADEEALRVLESDAIRNGLQLFDASLSTLAPISKLAQGILSLLLKSNRNKIVQQFSIGFDLDSTSVDIAKLRVGTYIIAQSKRNSLNWEEWQFQKNTGLIVNKYDTSKRLGVNHLTFNVTKYLNN